MDYDEALQYLLSLGHETLAIKLGLRNTKLLLSSLDNPQHSFPAVQIAGTNGKGSTAAFLDSICRRASIKTGLYTSPHLESITERIKVAGIEISREDFARCATTVRHAARRLLNNGVIEALPTFFEQVTAIALVAFRETRVELAILETGLGGRLDSTTAAEAAICAITDISLDHEEYLGNTIQSVAAEKAAIIHARSTVIVAPQTPEALSVIFERCAEVGVIPLLKCTGTVERASEDGKVQVTFQTSIDTYKGIWLGLRGRHQVENAGLAIQLAEVLRERGFRISPKAIVEGLETASHPGRLELFGDAPLFLLDGAHNPQGARTLQEFLTEFGRQPLTIIFGAMRDKRIEQIAGSLFPLADELILTEIDNPRSASCDALLPVAEKLRQQNVSTTTTSQEALKLALEKTPGRGMICVTGSLYLIGETRSRIRQRAQAFQKNNMTNPDLPNVIDSKTVFEGRVFDVTVDTIKEGELVYRREVVRHPGSAVIVPVFADETVALVRQYRHPAVKYLLEIPAGTLNEGERPEVGAARELEEELGVVAGKMEKLSEFFVSPGFCEEKMWVYLAMELTQTKQKLDDDELIEVVRVGFAEALEMISAGEIEDAKTIIGLMLAAPRIGSPALEAMYPAV